MNNIITGVDYCTKIEAEEIAKNKINETFFICPRCGRVFGRFSKHNYGVCCSYCVTDEDLRKIKENKEQMRKQMQELQEEIERRLKNENK
jgi:uncharacterized C2H2 Zn-finger protein